MSDKNLIVKKKGFSFLSFFLGILIGIILIAGALFGVGWYAATADLEKVMSVAGLNNKDEQGKDKYVNTDPENGGVKNIIELLQRVGGIAKEASGLTLAQVENLFPAAGGMAEKLRDSLSQYVDVNLEELKQVKFSELSSYINGVVMDIRPASFIEGEMNHLVELLLDGIEADCVIVDGVTYPLYADENNENYAYSRDGAWYSAQKTGDGFTADGGLYGGDAETLLLTGNYYIDNGEKIYVDPVTIGSLTGKGGMGALGRASILELFGETEENGMVEKLLGDITIDQFMNGEVDIDGRINSIEVGDFMDVEADDKIMAFFAYGISNLTQGEDGSYTAVYKLGEEEIPVNVAVENGLITGVTDADGEPVKGLTVGGIADISDKIDVSIFLNVTVDNKIIAYIAYGLTDIAADENGVYSAYVKIAENGESVENGEEPAEERKEKCTLAVNEGNEILSVTIDSTGERISAANVSELGDRVDGVFNDLKIRDLVDVGENKLLIKLGDYTLNTVSDGLDALEITDVMDVSSESAIMAYLSYGITKIDKENGTASRKGETGYETVYLDIDESGNITGVYPTAEKTEAIGGTKINEINSRVDGLMDELTIAELIPGAAGENNTILHALRDSTVNSLSDDINNLTINELYADEIYGGKNEAGETKKAEMKKAVEGEPSQVNEIKFDSSYLYYELVSGEYGEDSAVYKLVGTGDNKGKLAALPDDGKEYYTYGAPTKFWQLLVTERKDTEGGDEHAYSLNGLTDMIDNIHNNMQYFTLDALQDANILTFKSGELENTIPSQVGGDYGGKRLGELTIPDAIEAMVTLMNKFPAIGG